MRKNIILITGASSGIGREFAMQLDPYFSNIDEIWLVARRKEKLAEVASSLQHKTRILAMDITKESQLERLTDTLDDRKACIRMLINCAGYGLMGAFGPSKPDFRSEEDCPDGQLGMIRLNCEALTHITYRCLPYMAKGSRIIQLASSAAFLPQPYFAVYAATKAYVLSFSRALGEELKNKEIYVTSVCPGPVDTPFFETAEKTGTTLALKKYTMVSSERVVEQAIRDSYYKRTVSVCSMPIQAFQVLTKCVPHQMILNVMNYLKERE
ncbi:MAG: SDR family NAD(P)-dependent oxidoreductase [Lachnospiraceae bacterium]|nr:SDR family NAD(P)-dependent oxidoreductase [Lachnospiraceae bacterium]